jgi:hypothetical protein
MSEPSKGTQSKLSIRSVAGGFVVSWEVPSIRRGHEALMQAQTAGSIGMYDPNPCVETMERVCAGLPALLAFISETIKVQP